MRLYGITCPDRNEKIRQTGMQLIRVFTHEKSVEVEPAAMDQHGRDSAWVLSEEVCLNLELVRKGLAYWDRTQAPMNGELSKAEAEAKEKRLGIWAEVVEGTNK